MVSTFTELVNFLNPFYRIKKATIREEMKEFRVKDLLFCYSRLQSSQRLLVEIPSQFFILSLSYVTHSEAK